MNDFIAKNYIHILTAISILVFIIAILHAFSHRKKYINKRTLYIKIAAIFCSVLFVLVVYNEWIVYWFHDPMLTSLYHYELAIKIIYDSISIVIIASVGYFIFQIIALLKVLEQPLEKKEFSYLKKMAITSTIVSLLLVIRTVCMPLLVMAIRYIQNYTVSSNDIYLYSLPYLGLEEIVIIFVTIMLNMIAFMYRRIMEVKL